MKNHLLSAALVLGVATGAVAQPTIDGSIVGDEAFYGTPLSVQSTRTEFGDNNSADLIDTEAGGSEIDAVYAVNDGTNLHILVTGNLENNFNKMLFFFDTGAGGVNSLDGDNLPTDFDGFCCGQSDPTVPTSGGGLQTMDGLTFDTGFTANRVIGITNGGESVNGGDPDEDTHEFWAASAHYAELDNGSSGAAQALGIQTAPRGLPEVIRYPFDYNGDGVLGILDYLVARENQGATSGPGMIADGNGDGVVDTDDITQLHTNYFVDSSPSGPSFKASGDFPVTETQLLQNAVTGANAYPGLTQGDLIDNPYATTLGANGGGCTNNEGDGCFSEELEFVLEPAADEADNGSNHRLFENTIGLRMAIDNSNTAGVIGPVDGDFEVGSNVPDDVESEDPLEVTTGVELSIPLAGLGSPTGAIDLTVFINGSSFDFISNQFSGAGNPGDEGIGLTRGNIGNVLFSDGPDPPLLTMDLIPGDQFVTIDAPVSVAVPEPSSVALLTLVAGWGLAFRRR